MSEMPAVYRVQDADGRGPFRPGFSHRWSDEFTKEGMDNLPTWIAEFGADLIERDRRPYEHYGTAVRDLDSLNRWFSPTEQERLRRFHFHIVGLVPTRILAESANQLVFARKLPLALGVLQIPWSRLRIPTVASPDAGRKQAATQHSGDTQAAQQAQLAAVVRSVLRA